MDMHAWADESMRTINLDRPSYLLGATLADHSACDSIRDRLRELPRRGSKLHWRELGDRARRSAMTALSEIDVRHVIVVASPIDPRRQERARALCLERLAWGLDNDGVRRLTLEARPPQLMRRDIRTIDALRGRGALPNGLHIDHALPSAEPMLWIADQVLGAFGEEMTSGRAEWFDFVRHATTAHQLAL